jgi:hypothetical protein
VLTSHTSFKDASAEELTVSLIAGMEHFQIAQLRPYVVKRVGYKRAVVLWERSIAELLKAARWEDPHTGAKIPADFVCRDDRGPQMDPPLEYRLGLILGHDHLVLLEKSMDQVGA